MPGITTGALLGSAAIGGGSNIISNIIGALSNKKANDTNMKINQMNNDFNERMLQQQNQWNLEQWNREIQYNDKVRAETNAYNSAQAQVARYRQAGLNPTIMMQGQGAGTAQGGSAPSVRSGSASAASPLGVRPFMPNLDLGTPIQRMVDQYMQKDLLAEDVKAKRLQNDFDKLTLDTKIAEFLQRVEGMKIDNDMKRMLKEKYPTILNGQVRYMDLEARQMDMNYELSFVQKQLQEKELQTFAQRFGEESAIRVAQAVYITAQKDLTLQQKRTEIFETTKRSYEAQGVRDANSLARRMTDDIIDNLKKQNELLEKQKNWFPADRINGMFSNLLSSTLQGIMGYGMLKGFKAIPPIKGFGR